MLYARTSAEDRWSDGTRVVCVAHSVRSGPHPPNGEAVIIQVRDIDRKSMSAVELDCSSGT